MEESRLNTWEMLFDRALQILDTVSDEIYDSNWSFGGGTVLMRRHRHRYSKDIDIFIPDPHYLGYLSPRLNDKAQELTSQYLEDTQFLKFYFPEGEVDFVVSGPLTAQPTNVETILGRHVHVETSREIVAKKVRYRGGDFTARDIFDLAMVIEHEPESVRQISEILCERREAILRRISSAESILRKTFAELDVIEYRRSYDECVAIVTEILRVV